MTLSLTPFISLHERMHCDKEVTDRGEKGRMNSAAIHRTWNLKNLTSDMEKVQWLKGHSTQNSQLRTRATSILHHYGSTHSQQ